MDKISELKQQLERSDQKRISELTGIPYDTVNKILRGDRNEDTETGRRVMKAAKVLIDSKLAIRAELDQINR